VHISAWAAADAANLVIPGREVRDQLSSKVAKVAKLGGAAQLFLWSKIWRDRARQRVWHVAAHQPAVLGGIQTNNLGAAGALSAGRVVQLKWVCKCKKVCVRLVNEANSR
jgi:hypothetical protein